MIEDKKEHNENENKSLMSSSIDEFIKGHFQFQNEDSQTLDDSERDREIDNILSFIDNYTDENSCRLIDFGCGKYGTLFFNLEKSKTFDLNKLKIITYFGISQKIDYEEIKQWGFTNKIKIFGNVEKEIDKVFIEDNSQFEDIAKFEDVEKLTKEADIIVIKNVTHEIELKDLPFFLYKIFKLLKINKYFIFLDMLDLKEGEKRRFPWSIEDFKFLFEKSLNCGIISNNYLHNPISDPIKKGRGKEKRYTPLLFVKIRKDNAIEKESFLKLKSISLKFIEEKSKYYIKKKNDLISEGLDNNKMEEFIRTCTYHSNCIEQIEEAKKAWGM